MDLLNLCLTSTYFQYNGKHYKQLHGTAIGSSVSVVVAEIVETSVTVNNNTPIQDYVHRDDQTQPFEMTPGFKPFTLYKLLKPCFGLVA